VESRKQLKRSTEEADALRTDVASLRTAEAAAKQQIAEQSRAQQSLESQGQTLRQEKMELEAIIKDLESTISEKDEKIDELTKTNESYKRIQDMIHNISSAVPKT